MLVLCGIVVFGVVGFTALDRYDEQTCRQIPTPKLIVRRNPVYDSGDWAGGTGVRSPSSRDLQRLPAVVRALNEQPPEVDHRFVRDRSERCDRDLDPAAKDRGEYRLRMGTLMVDGYRIEPLSMRTWDAFADLAERHNGVWGGCWCTYFHRHPDTDEERRALGHDRVQAALYVEAGRARTTLVFDGDVAVAWARVRDIPGLWNIHHRKEWEKGVARTPDYRITCLFVDSGYRRAGMAAVAVRGALALIAAAGGGLVEAYPHDLPEGREPRHRSSTTPPGP